MGTGEAVVIILLVLAVGLLTRICLLMRRSTSQAAFNEAIQASIRQLAAAAQHHVQVNAVLALVEQFQDQPELLDHVGEYAQQTVAAALLYRVNMLAAAHKSLEAALSRALQDPFSSNDLMSAAANDVLSRLQAAQTTLAAFIRSTNS